MNRIRLLAENVANQIAAGEVVERPASVVKELVENALDAQGDRLIVEIEGGGRNLIRITDNGWGMSRDDALLCLERHATSKIQSANDLRHIATMGFRGEALPSIASVSRFTLTTRERDAEAVAATQVIIHGGRMVSVQDAGAPTGTSVEVRQLFYNLPARRKFLRSEETERAHIQHYLSLVALAYPEVAFTFTQDRRVTWQLPPLVWANPAAKAAAIRERIRIVHGTDEGVIPLDSTSALAPWTDNSPESTVATPVLRVWGFIGVPGVSRATREHQHLFVNRRPIENRGLNYALLEGYHTALMKGRYPVCCLFLEIDPAEVDVNIHPAKREVRFQQEKAVRNAVTQAIRQVLLKYHTQPGAPVHSPPLTPPALSKQSGPRTPEPASSPTAPPASTVPPSVSSLPQTIVPELFTDLQSKPALPATPHRPIATAASPPVSMDVQTLDQQSSAKLSAEAAHPSREGAERTRQQLEPPLPLLAVPLRIVGVIGRLYVVLESDRGLVLLDQHAAHERVLFEQMLQQLESGATPAQRLLLAETIELPPRDAQFVKDNLLHLTRLGLGLSEFGERTFLLDALPPFVHVTNPREFVMDVIAELTGAGEDVNSMRLGEHMVAKTVCRHAVKAHDPLESVELEQLLDQLRRCAMPYTCPHGRPTLIEISFKDLEKKFGRIQPGAT
jgi:DNA mismatch repair protein MutL